MKECVSLCAFASVGAKKRSEGREKESMCENICEGGRGEKKYSDYIFIIFGVP